MVDTIKLGTEQVEAIKKIKEFLNSEDIAFTLTGYAGTGKSFLVKELIKTLAKEFINTTLCAPTHKAKMVLQKFAEMPAMTLHKLLSLSPNIQIFELDYNDLQFYVNRNSMLFPTNDVIICDEASMINDDLFKMLIDKAKSNSCKIIFVGDKAQLKPVNAVGYSKVFNNPNKAVLTKIYRQTSENGLNTVLPVLREKPIVKFETAIGTRGSLVTVNTAKDLFIEAIPKFRKAIRNSDILEAKFLAYTNARVNAFNTKMREILFDNKKEYNKFEFLTGNDLFNFNGTTFYNSMDYIIISEPEKIDVPIPGFMSFPGYRLNLYNAADNESEEIDIISKDIPKDYLESLAAFIETFRMEAVELKQRGSRISGKKWAEYYKIMESFATPHDLFFNNRLIKKKTFYYGYAMTTHKS